ncbi:hypothetical protein [Pseudomonas costantinii]|uniref:hypothetical protein n=1 Tax=Pseudomonas costantinii TaxID=168469 RepID=UPI00159F8052|nr:hypothetical protein [Pseudomonas costantinii]NVZ69439.1 hypothetical protein [Pseudomonas costantinii]
MHSLVANTLFALFFLTANAIAAQPGDTAPMPHIRMMAHERMIDNDKVIYEADVDLNDPSLKQLVLIVDIGGFGWSCNSSDGHIVTEQISGPSGHTLQCVVREVKADGTADVDILYDLHNPARGAVGSGHISATVKAGKRYESTTQSGAKVSLLLNLL